MPFVSAIAQLNVDVLFSGFEHLPHPGEEVFSKQFSIQLGGGPQTIILALDRLGVPTKLGTFYTDDMQSKLGLMLLEAQGYTAYENLYRKAGHPTVVTSVLSFPEDRAFLAYNEQASDEDLTAEELYDFHKGARVCFAPSNAEVLQRLRADGTAIVFDTGWHDDLCMEKYAHMLRHVDVFTPNDKEAMKMTGAANAQEALCILAEQVRCPVVKLGREGCLVFVDGTVRTVPAVEEFRPVDTTGAGDNFLAGIAFGLYHGWDLLDCVRMGNVLGGHSTTKLGCLAAGITREEALLCFEKHYGAPRG